MQEGKCGKGNAGRAGPGGSSGWRVPRTGPAAGGCPGQAVTGPAGPAREDSGTQEELRLERSLQHVHSKLRKFKDMKELGFSDKVMTAWIPEA